MLMGNKKLSKIFKALRINRLPYMPFVLNVEPGNICNLKCPLCPTGRGDSSLVKGFLTLKNFKNIFDQFKGRLKTVNLYSWGEPLLNPEFFDIVRYIKRANKKIYVVTSTNLNIDDKSCMDNLISCGVDELIVSCDGAGEDTYTQYRRGGDFNLVVRNMKYLSSKRKEVLSVTRIVWNFLVFRHNEHEVEKARAMAEGIGVEFRVGLMRTYMKDEILKPHKEAIAKDIDWIPDKSEYSAYDKERLAPKKVIKTCRKPWQEITVNWNGEVFPCCAIYGDGFSVADTNLAPIVKIWNSEKYRRSRREILNKRLKAKTVCGLCRDNGFMHM